MTPQEKYACVQELTLDVTLTEAERAALRHVLGLVNVLADELARWRGTTVPTELERAGETVDSAVDT
jgi:hypothetical protein